MLMTVLRLQKIKPPDDLKNLFDKRKKKRFSFHRLSLRWKMFDKITWILKRRLSCGRLNWNEIYSESSLCLRWHFKEKTWKNKSKVEMNFEQKEKEGNFNIVHAGIMESLLIAGKLLMFKKLLFRLFNFVRKLLKLVFWTKGLHNHKRTQKDDEASWEVSCIKQLLFISICFLHFAISIFKSATAI